MAEYKAALPPPDIMFLIHRTAKHVARFGPEAEQTAQQQVTSKNNFLLFLPPGSPHKAYYDQLVTKFTADFASDKANMAQTVGDMAQTADDVAKLAVNDAEGDAKLEAVLAALQESGRPLHGAISALAQMMAVLDSMRRRSEDTLRPLAQLLSAAKKIRVGDAIVSPQSGIFEPHIVTALNLTPDGQVESYSSRPLGPA